MSDEEDNYDKFAEMMEERYPKMFSEAYGGFCIGEGWWPIIHSLCEQIQSHIDWVESTRERLLASNPHGHAIPDKISQVVVRQIKEKFGGLRFYFDGGDETIYGMVRMAEAWANHSCEECGSPATKQTSGWIKNLCDTHFQEHEARKRSYNV
jgi:hypothetical protein